MRATYDSFTDDLQLQHRDGTWLRLSSSEVARGAQLPAPLGGRTVRLISGGVCYRLRGHIYPVVYDGVTAPNITATWREIERQRPRQEQAMLLELIGAAVAVRGVASGALMSMRSGLAPAATARPIPRAARQPAIVRTVFRGRTLPVPMFPAGWSASGWFGNIIRWGRGTSGATTRLAELRRMAPAARAAEAQRLATSGVTREMASEWARYYRDEFVRSAAESVRGEANQTAAARAELMEVIAELLH